MWRLFDIKRITVRTCLWPIVICLCGSFALSVGLTYRSDKYCFAGTCGETLFPLQARLHVVVWYLWVSISVVFLAFRALHPQLRPFTDKLSRRHISIGTKSLSYTSILLIIWIFILYGSLVGVWWMRLHSYFQTRGQNLPGSNVVAAVAMTGHLADVTMGMVLLPVSRHSALASLFKVSPISTYMFHILAAYVLFTLVSIHGFLYLLWAIMYNANREAFRLILPVLNPTYYYDEVWPGNTTMLGYWRASLVFTGLASACIMLLVLFTSLARIRHRHFNLFYFTHLSLIIAVIVICLHASTMFYCTLPGILMWLLDWSMRLTELSQELDGQLKTIGNGWFLLAARLPSKRITGCASESPLAHFHVYHSGSSIRELHPFTTITDLRSQKVSQTLSDHITVEFLIRESKSSITPIEAGTKLERGQWTSKLCRLAAEEGHSPGEDRSITSLDHHFSGSKSTIKVRLEGPYFKTTNLHAHKTVICLVAGTGVTGAIAIARAFQARSVNSCTYDICNRAPKSTWTRCIVIWVVREEDFVDLPYWESLQCEGFELVIHKTKKGLARPDFKAELYGICGDSGRDCWVYISGPKGFMKSMEWTCQQVKGLIWTTA